MRRVAFGVLLLIAGTAPDVLRGQGTPGGTPLAAVGEAMFYRRSALADTARFDACSIYERTGQPAAFLSGLKPGLLRLLDRPVDDPCSHPRPVVDVRAGRWIRVDSVIVSDSSAQVQLHIRRHGWTHSETYHLVLRADREWSLREVRMTPALHTTPAPPREPE